MKTLKLHLTAGYFVAISFGSMFLTVTLSGQKMRGFSSFARNGIHVLKICEQVVTLMENTVARNSFVSPSLNFINTNTSSSLIRSFRFGPNFLGVDLNFRYIVDVVFLAPHQWRILPAVFAKCSYSALKLSLFGKPVLKRTLLSVSINFSMEFAAFLTTATGTQAAVRAAASVMVSLTELFVVCLSFHMSSLFTRAVTGTE